jgi:hypothetical protein
MRMYNYFLRSPHKQGAGAWEAILHNPGSGGFYGKHCFKELNDKAAKRRRRQSTIGVYRATTIGSSKIVRPRHANFFNLFKPLPPLLSYQRPIRVIHVFTPSSSSSLGPPRKTKAPKGRKRHVWDE